MVLLTFWMSFFRFDYSNIIWICYIIFILTRWGNIIESIISQQIENISFLVLHPVLIFGLFSHFLGFFALFYFLHFRVGLLNCVDNIWIHSLKLNHSLFHFIILFLYFILVLLFVLLWGLLLHSNIIFIFLFFNSIFLS